MKLYSVLRAAKYKITGGSEYLWTSYGPDVYTIDCGIDGSPYEDIYQQSWEVCVRFNTKNQTVYEVVLYDDEFPSKFKCYRWVNPKYIKALKAECDEKGQSFTFLDEKEGIKYSNIKEASKMILTIEKIVAKHERKRS